MEVKIRKREISCLAAAVVIVFCRRLRGEDVLLTSMKGILNCFEETSLKTEKSHVMVTLKGRYKG